LKITVGANSGEGCDAAVNEVLEDFVASVWDDQTFVSLLITDSDCATRTIANISATSTAVNKVQLISSQNLNEVYEQLTYPLVEHGYVNSTFDAQIVLNTPYYLSNYSTSCRSEMPHVPLVDSRPYHRPKYLYIAMDDMVWITVCATISVSVFGVIIYQHVKRQHKEANGNSNRNDAAAEELQVSRYFPKDCWRLLSQMKRIAAVIRNGSGARSRPSP
ncbi:hypothetical protein COOONC_06816, partial [Cooperia oncophora]